MLAPGRARRRRRSTEIARLATIIERQSAHLARLVDDLLDVSRVTAGKIVLQRGRVDVGELVASSVVSLAARRARAR